jgi:hypothetical protein
MKEIKATAVVKVSVEIQLTQPWNGKCPIEEVFKDAKRDAEEEITRLITNNERVYCIRLRGQPEVTAILAEEDK